MKFSNLIIAGLPKSFDVGFATDYIQPLPDDDVHQMIKDRKAYLKRLLTTKEGFTMQVLELQRQFVAMQCERPEEMEQ